MGRSGKYDQEEHKKVPHITERLFLAVWTRLIR